MKRVFRRPLVFGMLISVALLTAVTASGSSSKGAQTTISLPSIPAFTSGQDEAPSGNNWISINGNIYSWRYSTLSSINGSSGNKLQLAWSTTFNPPSPNPGTDGVLERAAPPEGNPLAYKGTVFVEDAWQHIYAINGSNGNIIWDWDPRYSENQSLVNPLGTKSVMSIGAGMVYTGAGGALYGINAQTGTQEWATQIVDPSTGSLMSVAPVYYHGLLIDGVDGGDSGGPAFLVALNAQTGKVAWTYNTIPGAPGEQGWNTWPAKRSYFGGGGIWDPVTVDPTDDLVYFGTANALPFTGLLSGPGEELDTESVLALHVMTGKFAWVFQEVHHDIWDYDAMQTPILAKVTIDGKTVRIVNSLNKDVYDYVLNAQTGKPAVAVDEVPVPQDPAQHTYPTQPIPAAEMPGSPNELVPHDPTQPQAWSGLTAPNGTPYVFATQPFTPYDASTYVVGPSTGVSWPENAYSPITGDIYMCANQGEGATASLPADDIHVIAGVPGSFGQIHVSSPLYTGSAGNLIAMNPANQDIMWRVNTPGVTCSSQVIATAGGIVLIGRADGTIDAFDALTGAEDWSFQTGSTSLPRIGVFGIHGQEYLTAQGTSIVNGATTYWLNAYTLPS